MAAPELTLTQLQCGQHPIAAVLHRGQQLSLLAHANGLDIRVQVVALADGKPDERIKNQNPSARRVVEATVRSAQLVEVSL